MVVDLNKKIPGQANLIPLYSLLLRSQNSESVLPALLQLWLNQAAFTQKFS
jgi:hypothetical protein